jgi:hypothetical protein
MLPDQAGLLVTEGVVSGIIDFLNLTSSRVFAALMTPVADRPLLALILWSAATGMVMAVLFRFTSNQQALGRAADRSRANMLAINLFQDDLIGVFRSLGRLLYHSAGRVAHSLPPLLVAIIPLAGLLTQLALWYESRPLAPGESAVVELQIDREHWQQAQHAQLQPPPGVTVEAGPLRDVGRLTVFWRIRQNSLTDNGSQPAALRWDVAGETVEKRLATSPGIQRLQPVEARRAGPLWWDQLLHPGEPCLPPGGQVRGIVIHYPQRQTPVFGWDLPWWLTFLIVSMLAALAVKPFVGVRF